MNRTGWQRTWVRTLTTLLTAAVMAMIFCFSMENAEQSDMTSGRISMMVIRILHPGFDGMKPVRQLEIYENTQMIVRKCAHFTEYMMLGFMIRLCLESWFGHRKNRKGFLFRTASGAGAAYACTDEIHQLAIDGRSGAWTDVLVDSSGVIAGAALAELLVRKTESMTETDRRE